MRVVLYSKTDCSLCDAFNFELMDLQTELGFAYETDHLDETDERFADFDGSFPVVDITIADSITAGSTIADSDQPIRLKSPTSQRQLRARIREVAAFALTIQGS